MSRLDELIEELCPDGVEYKQIKDIAWTGIGLATSVTKYKRDKGVVLIHNSDIKQNKIELKNREFLDEAFVKKNKNKVHQLHDIITVHTGDVGTSAVIEEAYVGSIGFTTIITRINDFNEVSPYYLSHYLNSHLFKAEVNRKSISDRNNLNQKDFEAITIAVPPLEVQREIVHILDYFMLLTTELTDKLIAEFTARKKQYEFYRDKLLSRDEKYPMKSLAELGKWSGGKTPSMSEKSFWEQGTVPWISSKDMKSSTLEDTQDHITEKAVKEASMTVYPANSIAVVTRSGILKHTFPVAYIPFETTINQDIKMLVVNEDILPRYAFHVIQGKGNDILVKTKKQGGTVDSLDFQKVLAYKVPVPSKDIQSKLVEVLDNFESICTDLNIGLPAEIEARQKQYEYYRDLLLTFAETGSMLMTDMQQRYPPESAP